MPALNRRTLLAMGAASFAAACTEDIVPSEKGPMLSLALPSVGRDYLGLKIWTAMPQVTPPRLTIDGHSVRAQSLESSGRVWAFLQQGLSPATSHKLSLAGGDGRALHDPWSLQTLPDKPSTPSRYRILVFSCAGGDEAMLSGVSSHAFLPLAARRALLDRALTFKPDLVVANGDHFYWDQATLLEHRNLFAASAVKLFYEQTAMLDDTQAFDAAVNTRAVMTIIERQIAAVYENRLIGTPVMFIADDHDYFENDMAGPWGATFPPKPLLRNLQSLTKRLSYPVLPPNQNPILQSMSCGDLLDIHAYDCRRNMSRAAGGGFLDAETERQLLDQTRASSAHHLIHMPSTPVGWGAGKWAEWYPDRGSGNGSYGDDKDYWNPGWFEQHQRILGSIAESGAGEAMIVSGDLHASAAGRLTRSAAIDLSARPITTLLAGPLGTGDVGFPSAARGQRPWVPKALELVETIPLEERNGFTIIDFTPGSAHIQMFRWRPPEPLSAIAELQPSGTMTIATQSPRQKGNDI